MKFCATLIIVLSITLSAFSQKSSPSLNQSLSEMFKQNFSDWQVKDSENAFYPITRDNWKFNPQVNKADEASDLESVWKKDKKEVRISIKIVNDAERDQNLKMFLIRNITPPNYKIKDLGSEAYLIKFHDRVEIAFVKFNVFTRIAYSFPSKYKKQPYLGTKKSINAPPEEVEFAQKSARLIADEITQTYTTEKLTGIKVSQSAN